jgi:phage/plasmid-like protein (TIGR03299 family)
MTTTAVDSSAGAVQGWGIQNRLLGFQPTAGPSTFTGPVPEAEVRKMIGFEVAEGTLESTIITPQGVTHLTDETRKVMVRVETGKMFGVFGTKSYQRHGYNPWLTDELKRMTGHDGLGIASAGLMNDGGKAWVQVRTPQTCYVEGVEFYPFVTAGTSIDGTLATTYQTGAYLAICGNVLSSAADKRVKIRHSSKSMTSPKRAQVADVLGLLHQVEEAFTAQVQAEVRVKVSDKVYAAFVESLTAPKGDSVRTVLKAERAREELMGLWNDERVAQWKGTAFGVVQAVNTYNHHVRDVRNVSRDERNTLAMVKGERHKEDAATLVRLQGIMSAMA